MGQGFDQNFELLFLGNLVPDSPEFNTAAFSRAGNMCQISLLQSFKQSGLSKIEVISVRPIPSFPRSDRVWIKAIEVVDRIGVKIKLLPFINVTPLKQLGLGLLALIYVLSWGWRKRKVRDRVIYTYNISVPPGAFILFGAWLTKCKCVAMVYDLFVPGETVPNNMYFKLDYTLHKFLLPKFDALVAISADIGQDFAPATPTIVIEGGINNSLAKKIVTAMEGNKTNNPGDHFIMSMAGRLDDINGIPIILGAFELLIGDNYRLEIAGAGPLESEVLDAARKDKRIKYHGFMSMDQVINMYKRSDILLNIRDTKKMNTKYFFPSKLMEYLCSGVLVISTCNETLRRDYNGKMYFLLDETALGLAKLLMSATLLSSSERTAIGMRGQTYILSSKTWDIQGKKILDFLSQSVSI